MREEYLHIVNLPHPDVAQDTLDIRDYLASIPDNIIAPCGSYWAQLQRAIDENDTVHNIIHRDGFVYYFFSNDFEQLKAFSDKFGGCFVRVYGQDAKANILEEDGCTTLETFYGDEYQNSYAFDCFEELAVANAICYKINWEKFGNPPHRFFIKRPKAQISE